MKFLANPLVRWIIFLPGALLVTFLVTLIFRFTHGIWFDSSEHMTLGRAFGEGFISAVSGGVLIYSAAWLAPRGKEIIAVVLTTLMALVSVFGLIISFKQGEYLSIIVIIGWAAGYLYSTYLVHQSPPDLNISE